MPVRRARTGGPSGGTLAAVAVAVVMGLMLGRFVFAGRGADGARPSAAPGVPGRGASPTEAQVASLQERLRRAPDDAPALTRLAVAYLGRARETADPSYFTKAGEAVDRSLALDGSRSDAMTAAGLLALGRHDFAAALEWGLRASAAAPDSADPLGVVVDAQVELGRYDEAAATAQRMVDRRPSLTSLARVSYLRELHGDRRGAVDAMTRAALAGSGRPADVADVHVLLGDLHLGGGDLDAARQSYSRALNLLDGYGPALAGMARVVGSADPAGGAALLEPVVRRQPLPAWAALLGDLYEAAGQPAAAADQFDLARRVEALNRANGVAVDLEAARFEADHGGAEAVDLARAALAARPTVFAHDALGWALRQAGRPGEALDHARAAVRLGTADALLWYHLAAVEADLGMAGEARDHLARAFAVNPLLTIRDRPAATALAARLGINVP